MWAAAKVRRFIFSVPKGKLFTRRELIQCGASQGIVDQEIGKMIRSKVMVRMAWGVYVRPNSNEQLPTVEQVADTKIKAFGRKNTASAKDVAKEHGLSAHGERVVTYETDGSPSSFRVFKADKTCAIVYLRRRPARKLLLGYRTARKAIKALWFVGNGNVREAEISKATALFGRTHRQDFLKSLRWMPGWLSDLVVGQNPTRTHSPALL
jgi:hypothetical protein